MTDAPGNNPLLDFSGLPRFADFRPTWVEPALDTLLADARAALESSACLGHGESLVI
jgi:oligopeptidase A